MTVVYADVLFLINFCMDFLALYLSGAMLHLPTRPGRLALGAAAGGTFAVASVLYAGYAWISAILGLLMAVLLCAISYGGRCGGRRYFALISLFFIISWLFGGMITAFYSFLSRFFEAREEMLAVLLEGDGRLPLFFLLALLCALLIGLGRRRFSVFHKQRTVLVTIREGEKAKTLTALVDSGNTLCDPLSGKPCIVLDSRAAADVIPPDILAFSKKGAGDLSVLSAESRRRIRLIPSESLGGHRLLVGYLPTDAVIEEKAGHAHSVDAVVVPDEHGEGGFCGYSALVPSVFVF